MLAFSYDRAAEGSTGVASATPSECREIKLAFSYDRAAEGSTGVASATPSECRGMNPQKLLFEMKIASILNLKALFFV